MSTSESLGALRRANPRAGAGFAQSVEAAAATVRTRIPADTGIREPRSAARRRPRRLVGVSVFGASLAAAVAAFVLLTAGSPGRGTGTENAAAAVRKATTLTAAAADHSGIAAVRITHGGETWAGTTIRWHEGDLAVSRDVGRPSGRPGSELILVDGMLYGTAPDGGWVVNGDPKSIDPGTGTTPSDYLASVREHVGGVTLRRITGAMTGLTITRRDDGSTVYRGNVAAGLIARKTGFKEGQSIRVLPFGYVAHDDAADPSAPLETALTVGADGIVRKITVTWGTGASAWNYTVMYSGLGATPALSAPTNARPLRNTLRAGKR